MPDVFTKAKRSEVMSRIRGKGNKGTELALISVFRRYGITGWRRHQKIFGKPDFVFRRERLAVFADGCFWHACPIHATRPKTNETIWGTKLAANKARDMLVTRTLQSKGWRVIRIWEHDITAKKEDKTVRRISAALCRTPQRRCKKVLALTE